MATESRLPGHCEHDALQSGTEAVAVAEGAELWDITGSTCAATNVVGAIRGHTSNLGDFL